MPRRSKYQDKLVRNVGMIEPGDVIIFSYWSLKHAAIVVRIAKGNRERRAFITIIHYALDTLFGTRKIKQETVSMDLSRNNVYRRDYEDETYPPDQVITRAKSRVNERRFNINGNTSWDLVKWAKVVQTFDDDSRKTSGTMTSDQCFKRLPVYAWDDLKPGIILEYTYYMIWHQGIVTNVNDEAKKITVIHYGTNTLVSTRTIMEDTFRIDLRNTQLWMYRFNPNFCNPPEVIVEKAHERLGEQRWGYKNRSWDFCKDCVLCKE